MLIAIDYDKTYTEDPDMWDRVIGLMEQAGHKVVCVTLRYGKPEGRKPNVPFINTMMNGKDKYCKSIGLDVDVWIDDCPMWIERNYEQVV